MNKEEKEEVAKEKEITDSLAGEVAESLHKDLCISEHVEHCEWNYEELEANKWEGSTHKAYLEKAKKLLKHL